MITSPQPKEVVVKKLNLIVYKKVLRCVGIYLFIFLNIFIGMLHYISFSNTTCYLHLILQ